MKKLICFDYNKVEKETFDKRCIFSRFVMHPTLRHVDRFDYFNQFSRYNFVTFNTPKPKENRSLDYKELILQRAQYFAQQYPDGIAIAYSGGVDSVGIICALLAIGYPVRKLHILCNRFAITEYPHFFNQLAYWGCKITLSKKWEITEHFDRASENVILTGHCNDQYFHLYRCYQEPELHCIPIEQSLSILYKRRGIEEYFEQDFDRYLTYSKLLNWDVEDLFDLAVLINFGCHYTYVQDHIKLHILNPDTRDKVTTFYDGQALQDWAFTYRKENKEQWKLSLNDPAFYKKQLKDLIREVYPDEEYLKTKSKGCSWEHGVKDMAEGVTPYAFFGLHDEEGYHVSLFDRYLDKGEDRKTLWEIQKILIKDYLKEEFK